MSVMFLVCTQFMIFQRQLRNDDDNPLSNLSTIQLPARVSWDAPCRASMRTMLLKHSAACDTWPVGGGRTFCPSPSCTQRWTRPPPAYSGQQDSSGAIHTLRNNIFRATQCRGSPDTHQHSVTLTTQCSLDRWPRFIQQAKSWGGPVSVAVYIPAPQHTAAANAALEIVQHWAAEYVAQHPTQQLHVTTLCANHYAREGASVLSHTGVVVCTYAAAPLSLFVPRFLSHLLFCHARPPVKPPPIPCADANALQAMLPARHRQMQPAQQHPRARRPLLTQLALAAAYRMTSSTPSMHCATWPCSRQPHHWCCQSMQTSFSVRAWSASCTHLATATTS